MLYAPFLTEGKATIAHVVAHIDHIVSLVGPDHVGIGSDLDGGFGTGDAPLEIQSVADLRLIGEALARKGYEDAAVSRILGENWMRVLRQALPA